LDGVGGEEFGVGAVEVDADLGHGGTDSGVDLVSGGGSGGADLDPVKADAPDSTRINPPGETGSCDRGSPASESGVPLPACC
jgi:hypothetical protein